MIGHGVFPFIHFPTLRALEIALGCNLPRPILFRHCRIFSSYILAFPLGILKNFKLFFLEKISIFITLSPSSSLSFLSLVSSSNVLCSRATLSTDIICVWMPNFSFAKVSIDTLRKIGLVPLSQLSVFC